MNFSVRNLLVMMVFLNACSLVQAMKRPRSVRSARPEKKTYITIPSDDGRSCERLLLQDKSDEVLAIERKSARQSLFSVVRDKNEFLVQDALERKPDIVNEQDENGDTALFLAVRDTNIPMIKILADRGAISVKNYDNESPLTWAVNNAFNDEKEIGFSTAIIDTIADHSSLRIIEEASKRAQLLGNSEDLNRNAQKQYTDYIVLPLVKLEKERNAARKRQNKHLYNLRFGNDLKRRRLNK